jgi:hypothetical protein
MVAIGPERPERKTAAFKENGNCLRNPEASVVEIKNLDFFHIPRAVKPFRTFKSRQGGRNFKASVLNSLERS